MHLKREFRKLKASFLAAFAGIKLATVNERNFRIHICMLLYVLIFAWLGNVPTGRAAVLVLCIGLVLAAELINSAIELVCDVVSDKFDVALRAIKDMSAGAVLVLAIASAAAGLIIFLEPTVLKTVFDRLFAMPYIAGAIVASIPFAILFIIRKGD